MNILFLAPIVPYPPVDGDRQRAFHLIRHLAARHQVQLLCFYHQAREKSRLEEMTAWCASVQGVPMRRFQLAWNAVTAWPTAWPLNVAAYRSAALARQARRWIQSQAIDMVYAYRLRMAPYAVGSAGPARVLDYTDSLARHTASRLARRDSAGWRHAVLRREAKALARYESRVSGEFDATLISSTQDQAYLQELGVTAKVHVVTNGVDSAVWTPAARLPDSPEVIFVANLEYAANRQGLAWFLEQSWPVIRAQVPHARLTVVGKRPAGSARSAPGVVYTGIVPEVNSWLQKARIGICPLLAASGRQFKVIEYFSSGVPCVATPVVAANLGAEPERHLLIGETGNAFARQVVRLCQDQGLAERLRAAGRALVVAQYDWSVSGRQLDAILESLPRRRAC